MATPHFLRAATRSTNATRAIFAGALTVATVLVLTLVPQAVQAFDRPILGNLRSPGEMGFVAGHRGDRADAPENTLPAFEMAFDGRVAFVETDVQLTADGHPVLIHDRTLDRTTTGTGPVAATTLAEIRTLDAGSWFDPRFSHTRVPLLAEFLALLADRPDSKAMLELKGRWGVDDVQRVVDEVMQYGVDERVVFASFYLDTVSNLGKVAEDMPRIIIRRDLPDNPVRLAEYYGATAIMTSLSALDATPNAVDDLHQAGISVLVYTLNSSKRWSQVTDYGVDGIVTDEPARLQTWMTQAASG